MELYFDNSLAIGYKSHSQIARRLTEDWVERNMFCPVCGNPVLTHYENNNPNFFFMNYADGAVNNLWLIPNHFFTPSIIEKRKPLSENAQRAGWTGCSILLDDIPESGKIAVIRNSVEVARDEVLYRYKRTEALVTKNLESRGWLMDVLACVERLPGKEFTLQDMYLFTDELQQRHPSNSFVQPKIRQQLQCLRDKGYIEFLGRGCYRKRG